MDAESLRWLLVTDWAEIENTPDHERRPAELYRWRRRVRCLAEMQARPLHCVEEELQEAARRLAFERRRDLEAELARDLAFQRATGRGVPPPWNRRLHRLAAASGRSLATVRAAVEQAASAIRVVFAE